PWLWIRASASRCSQFSLSSCQSWCPRAALAPPRAGQCSPPYQLDVRFHVDTSLATEQAVVAACTSHNPVVLGVTYGVREAVVKTSQIHVAQTRALIR